MDDVTHAPERPFAAAIFSPDAVAAAAGLLSADKAETLYSLLTSHRRHHRDDAAVAMDPAPLYDRYQAIYETLPPSERKLFCLFTEQAFGVSYRDYGKPADQKHQFSRTFTAEADVGPEEAQDFLIGLYDSNRKKCFAIALSYFVSKFRHPFLEELCQHDRFNRHVAIIDRPSTSERSGYVTPLVLVVSNSPAAPYVERTERAAEGAVWSPSDPDAHFNDGFEIISSDGVFSSLAQATATALANQGSSRLYGRYGGTPNASMDYESLVLAHAEVLRLIKDGSNFFADAVQRAEYQKDQCAGLYHGGMFGQRFLKQDGYPTWAQAVWNRFLPASMSDADVEETGYQMTKHAMFRVLTLSYVYAGGGKDNDLSARRRKAFLAGFARAVSAVHEDLADLIPFDDRPSRTLDRYEACHGFHKDLDVLTVAERKKAAYADLADYFSGAFSFNPVMGAFLEDEDDKDFRLKDQLPYRKAFDQFIDTGDFTHAWRLLTFLGHFGKHEQAELLQAARSKGIAFLNCGGLRIGPKVPRDGREVALCFSGDDTFVMPPLGGNVFIEAKDLTISGPQDTVAALNIDYGVMALEKAAEQALHADTRVDILGTAEALKQRTGERLRDLGFVPAGAAHFYQTMASQPVPVAPPAAKPRFWRAARIMDAISNLGQQQQPKI